MKINLSPARKSRSRVPVLQAASSLSIYRAALEVGHSKREAARIAEAPRSSLTERDDRLQTPFGEDMTEILQSPSGVSFLQRLLSSALLTFVTNGGVGVPTFCRWLAESGLAHFVVSSVSKWQEISRTMQDLVVEICAAEKERLAREMKAPKEVMLGLDETFFPKLCLVGADLLSGFLFCEELSEARSAEAWAAAWEKGTDGLKLNVIQVVADGGLGIRGFAEGHLGVHRSPDLFHVLHDISKGIALALARRQRSAEERVEEVRATYTELKKVRAEATEAREQGRRRTSPRHLAEARGLIASAERQLQVAKSRREEFRALLKSLSDEYLPICLDDGTRKGASFLARRLEEIFIDIRALADSIALPDGLKDLVRKAERVVPAMVRNLEFFSKESESILKKYRISGSSACAVHAHLVPAAVLARRAASAVGEERRRLLELAREHREEGLQRLGSEGEQDKMRNFYLSIAEKIASRWQRSSSAIEGRNGLLSQRRHSLRGLDERKLTCLTALANFYAKRSGGTTAANRLFGALHVDLAEVVIERMPIIPRALRREKRQSDVAECLSA